jgi:uncharacterized protein (UPF0371 family)
MYVPNHTSRPIHDDRRFYRSEGVVRSVGVVVAGVDPIHASRIMPGFTEVEQVTCQPEKRSPIPIVSLVYGRRLLRSRKMLRDASREFV